MMLRPTRRGPGAGHRGFTLVELAVALVVLGLIALFARALVPWVSERMRLDDTTVDLSEMRKSIDGYAWNHHHLPCPDVNGNGFEDRDVDGACEESVGGVPFRTLGLGGQARDEAFRPLRYGVYRSPAADLTVLSAQFEPRLPDTLTIVPGTVTGCSSDGDLVMVVFDFDDMTIFRVQNSGGFSEGEYIGLGIMVYEDLVTDPDASPCPCGEPVAPATDCPACTAFPPGTLVQGETSGDVLWTHSTPPAPPPLPPGLTLPGGASAFYSGYPTATFALPETLQGITVVGGVPENSGVSATGLQFIRLLARVVEIDGNDLKVEVLESLSNSVFQAGQTLTPTGGPTGSATVSSVVGTTIFANIDSGTFTAGEEVTNGTETAVVAEVSPASYTAEVVAGVVPIPVPDPPLVLSQTVSGAVTHVLSARDARVVIAVDPGTPPPDPVYPEVGDQIVGGVSGATAFVTLVDEGNALVEGLIVGTTVFQAAEAVSFTSTPGPDPDATGTVSQIIREIAGQVVSGSLDPGEQLTGGGVTADIVAAIPTPNLRAISDETGLTGEIEFMPGMQLYSGDAGGGDTPGFNSMLTEIIEPTTESFQAGDTVQSSPGGASGTVTDGGTGTNWVLLDGVSGTFVVGHTISSPDRPNAGGEIIDVRENQTVLPTAFPGSITREPNESTVLNNLDFCQILRTAHSSTVLAGSGSNDVLHTVSPAGPTINPAYLIVSGGVENADGVPTDIAFDGLNRIAEGLLTFHSPGLRRGPDYDDIVTTMPVQQLEQRLQCGINIGAVNAKAANATTMKNNLLLAFWLNEQAIRNVEVSYQAWQMAEVDLLLAVFGLVLDTVSTTLSLYKDLMYSEGAVGKKAFETAQFALALAIGITDTALAIADIVDMAESSVGSAKATFEAACEAQEETLAALSAADLAASAKLQEAIEIDELGGVR